MAILALSALDLTAVCLSALLILPLSSILYWTARLLRNYLAARRMSPGLPIIVIPIDHTNRLWSIIDRQCLSFLDRFIPFWSIKRTVLWRYNVRGWEIPERYHTHRKLGDVFAMVSPSRIWLYVGDPDAATEVLKRGNDFPRCLELTEILNVFGPNISTVEGSRWKVQRKIMQSCFNEPNNEIVWSEAVSQGTDMLQYWTKSQARTSSSPSPSLSSSGVATIADDLRTLSLHVLSRAGFGKSSKFQGYDEVQKKKKETSGMSDASDGGGGSDWYRDSLQVILENCILIMVLGPEFLAKPWLPRRLGPLQLGQVHQACVSFQGYMREMYEEGKRRLSNADGFHGGASSATKEKGFMASLVRASQEEGGGGGDNGLTEGEIYGNMFVLNFAGHDTITHTITFGVYFLAIYPNMQAWLAEELRAVLGTRPPNEWSYTADFPRLKRCLAVLLETLRLYNPIPLGKWTGENTVSLSVGDRRLLIPPKTMVCPSYSSLQTDPKYWGYVSLEWRPQRWIETTGPDGEEMVKTPRRGTFLPWSEGVRDCPGKKFSQIEFVATMASLFRDWRVDPACLPGEDLRAARLRVSTQIRTDSWPVLLLQMLHPEKAPLVWSRR